MSTLLVHLALGNLVASAVLAGAAFAVHRHGRYPALAHLLWVFVLLKLVTPPLLTLPVLPAGATAIDAGPSQLAAASGAFDAPGNAGAWLGGHVVTLLLAAWAAGSLVVLAVSLLRIGRFDRMLRRTTTTAPPALEVLAAAVGERFGLRRLPAVVTTSATISPMTWWTGRRVLVVVPAELVAHLSAAELRWVLAHELAHVKRHDHFVRWLEWLACVAFWWNPVAWWARHNLRHDEEASCDAFVLEHLERRPRSYAGALLAVVELLARGVVRPPAIATGIDGGSLERRFALIVAAGRVRRAPRSLAVAVVSLALLLLPLGMGAAAEPTVESAVPAPAVVAGVGAGAGADSVDADEARFGLASASVEAASVAPDVARVQDRLAVAERKLRQARQALKQDAAPKKAERKLEQARRAVRQAEKAVQQADAAPKAVKRDVREVRQALRRMTRSWREAKAG